MTLRDRRTRRTGARTNGERQVTRTPLGGVRRAQIITTFGVGSMIAIGDRSFVVSGLDTWRVRESDVVYEPRLQHWLGVNSFQLPPADVPSSGDGVKIRLFPEIYSCPECRELKEFGRFGSPPGKSLCGTCEKALVPSRFVIACENGHLDDFPYFAWVHKKTSPIETDARVGHDLSLHSTGRTASLRSVLIKCSCGKSASLEGAFGKRAMAELGIRCKGRRPWLKRGSEQPGCTAVPRTLQRGSSAAWFPINRSALSIPPWSETLHQRVNPYYESLGNLLNAGVAEEVVLDQIRLLGLLGDGRFTAAEILEAVRRRMELAERDAPDSDEEMEFEPANDLRHEEYDKLYDGAGRADRDEDFECVRPTADVSLPYGVEKSMLVKRLREVRALQSFTRVEMPDPSTIGTRRAALSAAPVDWLPATEVSGEGVFLAIDQRLLRDWESRSGPTRRSNLIRNAHTELLRRRARTIDGARALGEIHSPIRSRYVLLHTLAHVLINEWSLDSGYPAAALCERLYVDEDMAGVLIYTATSDSAGSLGGLVAQGEHRKLHETLESALERARWCSQDPPCIESEASGVDSLNLAACYACVLLPETSCETNNVFLDRALLIGTPDDPSVGFFHED